MAGLHTYVSHFYMARIDYSAKTIRERYMALSLTPTLTLIEKVCDVTLYPPVRKELFTVDLTREVKNTGAFNQDQREEHG